MSVGESAIRKAKWRLLPFLIGCYFLAYLDRANVGIAALEMNADLGFTPTIYAFGSGIFFIGYFLFEVPSNWALDKFGARVWIARIMVTWGALAAATAFVWDANSFYWVRFLLGVAEAGFLPGVVLYLSRWFPSRERAAIMAIFFLGLPLSYIIGSPLSGALLNLDGLFGMAGWKLMFLPEGIPTIIVGFFCLKVLTDKPADAKWLEPAERQWLTETIAAEGKLRTHGSTSFGSAFRQSRVWVLGLAYVGIIMGIYGIGLWLPQIVKPLGYGNFGTGVISAIPYVIASVAMVLWSRSSDRRNERRWHAVLPCLLACVSLVLSATVDSQLVSLMFLTIAAVGILASMSTFWAIPTAMLSGAAAASGIAVVNSIGNLGGFAGPYLVGYIRESTGSFQPALFFLAICPLVSAVILYRMTSHKLLPGATVPSETNSKPAMHA
jgi:MFS transporter, ACS family, tartrate transporter